MQNTEINAADILEQAVLALGSLSAVSRKTGLDRGTLKFIRKKQTLSPHADTIAKLVKASRSKPAQVVE
ncbi:hypothetical protein [Limnoglobus roseus]|uniref:HTH cro/C1-type domain-containing protein n=1 Tax=Limnoglobus roseus TaxID=2598579 RepID=A0A5C1AKP8_9BACT|nr:hypothetical protein [Limnoglobus roseus]QEL18737.1 hypothetical protein PX52LOC_05773 [Limnoglobus roseus]